MIVNPRHLLPEQVRNIKALLWDGHMSQPEIAALHNTHQTGISRILNGYMWGEIEWPDGSSGRMDPERHKVITSSRKRNARYRKNQKEGKLSEETSKVLDRINEIINTLPNTRKDRLLSITLGYKNTKSIRGKGYSDVWKDICRQDPYNPIVREIKSGKQNPALIAALCLTLQEIPLQDWSRKSVLGAIYKLSHWIENNP